MLWSRQAASGFTPHHQFPQHCIDGFPGFKSGDPDGVIHAPVEFHHSINQAMQIPRLPEHNGPQVFDL
jgi:hypothetical protein